jgi:alanyl aminopeptidase
MPKFEAIHLNLDAGKLDYTGSVRVEMDVLRMTSTIQLHSREINLRSIHLRGKKGEIPVKSEGGEEGLLTLTAENPLLPGAYTLEIDFTNDFDRRATGLYRLDTGGAAYSFTQFQAVDARWAFPCWDEPSFKFPYQITLTVPEAHEAISNTPIESQMVLNGARTVVFRKTKPLPSYLLAIATGPLEYVPVTGTSIPTRIVVPKGQTALARHAAATTPPILRAVEKYFGRPYPYEKLDLIAVPEFTPGAMENPGAITYGDQYLLFEEATMSLSQKRTFAWFTAHELAHMWFGDMVTMKWWDDLWLNESFAQWVGDKIAGQVYPEYQVEVETLEGRERAMVIDARLSTRAIHQPVVSMDNLLQAADALTYQKGETVLAMFEQWMGPDVFRKAVLAYLKKYEWKNAEAKDLWDALARVSGKDVHGAMATFLDQPGVPLVSAEAMPDGRVRLAQTRFLNYGVTAPGAALWRIPVTIRYSDGMQTRLHTVLLDQTTQIVELPGLAGRAPEWIHPNAGEVGYYRWSVDPATQQKLVAQARSILDSRERIGLIQNASALLDAGRLRGDEYLEIVAGFANDDRPEVVRAVNIALGGIRASFVPPAVEPAFAAYVRRVLSPAAARYGYDRAPNEEEAVSLVRPGLLARLAEDGRDEAALAYAEKLARSFLADRSSVDPSLLKNAIALSAIRGDAALFDEYQKRFESATVPTDRNMYLAALGTFRDPALQARALEYVLKGPLRPNEIFNIPSAMGSREAEQPMVYEWITRNYDVLIEKLPPIYAIYLPYFGAGCDQAMLDRMHAFFSDPTKKQPGGDAELARALEAGGDCVSIRKREGEAVRNYLTHLADAK